MYKNQEFKLINATDKLDKETLDNYKINIDKIKNEIKPSKHQAISLDGKIIIEGDFHQDGTVTYKIPKKEVNYEINKFPVEYQEKIEQLRIEYNLTKKEINELNKSIKNINLKQLKIEDQLKSLEELVQKNKSVKKVQNKLKLFDKKYTLFWDCLTSELGTLNLEDKIYIKQKLEKLICLIQETIDKYLK